MTKALNLKSRLHDFHEDAYRRIGERAVRAVEARTRRLTGSFPMCPSCRDGRGTLYRYVYLNNTVGTVQGWLDLLLWLDAGR